MARHGTLPEFMYQRQCEISEKPVSIAFDKQGNTADASRENDLNEDEEDDFDESSDEEVVEDLRGLSNTDKLIRSEKTASRSVRFVCCYGLKTDRKALFSVRKLHLIKDT